MCFSATASFAVSGVLVMMGTPTIVWARHRRELPLASLPLLFAGHQFVEGLLWVRLSGESFNVSQSLLVHAFLVFALVLLPILVPTSTWLVEPRYWRRRTMILLIGWNSAVASVLLATMILSPYDAGVHEHSIRYRNSIDPPAIEYLYALGVTAPLLASTHRTLVVLGFLAAALFAITKVAFSYTYISVWCFFAAISSALVFVHFFSRRRSERHLPD